MPRRAALLLALSLMAAPCLPAAAQEARVYATLSRAGAVALIVESSPEWKARLSWYEEHMPPLPLFSDVDQSLWYAPYLEVAFEQGIIIGNAERRFRPSEVLTIEEAAVLMTRMREAMDPPPPPVLISPETDSADWFAASLLAAEAYEIALPVPFAPGYPVTRGQFFTMLRSVGVAHPETIALSIDPRRGIVPVQIAALDPVAPVETDETYEQDEEGGVQQPTRGQRAPTQQPARPVVAQPPARTTTPSQPVRPPVTQPTQPTRPPVTQPPANATVPNASNKYFAISMPSLGIKDLTISHPTDPLTSKGLLAPLQAGVGHLFSYPGKGGKILVYGHSSSYPWDVSSYTKIFRQINKLSVGDKVYVTYDGQLHVYQITTKQTVPAKDVSAYRGTGEELILYTCWPPDSIAERYLVRAKPVETIALR